jgi:hypothetical protein
MKTPLKIALLGTLSCFVIVFSFHLLNQLTVSSISNPEFRVLGAAASTNDPLQLPQFIGTFGTTDARIHIIKDYLKEYSSPLLPFAKDIVAISDKYTLDYRLLVAIARQESNLCKKIPEDSYNCWGFGIYGDKVTRFDNYPQALEIVAKTLKKQYIDIGLNTPEKIMAKYTPPSLEIGGPWAKGVNQFMTDLE